MDKIVEALRNVKQEMFDEMVEGNGRQPAEVVDMVVYAIQDHLPADVKARMWPDVLNFYPDYEGGNNV
jgi:hypothetical protein